MTNEKLINQIVEGGLPTASAIETILENDLTNNESFIRAFKNEVNHILNNSKIDFVALSNLESFAEIFEDVKHASFVADQLFI